MRLQIYILFLNLQIFNFAIPTEQKEWEIEQKHAVHLPSDNKNTSSSTKTVRIKDYH